MQNHTFMDPIVWTVALYAASLPAQWRSVIIDMKYKVRMSLNRVF
jgi:hypothetical protein